jgi:anaerobic selenocysteine-containing dehydrogenase
MSETAKFVHYLLPCRNAYESWDGTFFSWTYPGVYFQLRRPLVEPAGSCREASQIFTDIADRLGIIPEIPEAVREAARGNRLHFGARLIEWAAREPAIRAQMTFILAKTLGEAWNSANKAALWGMLTTAPKSFRENAARAGFTPGIDQGDRIFQAILDAPQGLWVGQADTADPMAGIATASGKIAVYIAELEKDVVALNAVQEEADLRLPEAFPLILGAGRHMKYNANTLMRNPAWNTGRKACTVAMHPDDIVRLGLGDGQQVRVTTEAGSEVGELERSSDVRPGTVLIPHGFGLDYDGQVYGININRLTRNSNRDRLGTPLHRFVPCRVERA